MKSLMCSLSRSILAEAGIRCNVATSADYKTIVRRVEHEGISFLTISLPVFSKIFERGLADGYMSSVPGFRNKSRTSLPAFLQGFLAQVFEPSGCLRHDCSIDAISCIRQICLMWKKIQLPCSDSRIRSSLDAYIRADDETAIAYFSTPDRLLWLFKCVSNVLWHTVLDDADYTAVFREYDPRHGKGATAQKIFGNSKWSIDEWHQRLEPSFPWREFAKGYAYWGSYSSEEQERADTVFLAPGAERPVRVISVPKTLTGPRIIGIEPVCMQYTQQALLPLLVSAIESNPLTKGKINFTSQSLNKDRALSSSRDGKFASLDLKEASDRVPLNLVEDMLRSAPTLRDAIMACRSTSSIVKYPASNGITPISKRVNLAKFASMGSALCFPIEAMVFFTMILVARLHNASKAPSLQNIKKYSEGLLVYGDDLFVPTQEATAIMDTLSSFGTKINTSKSFWTGKFRESCGMDAYDGTEVTPVYCRKAFPCDRRDAEGIVSWVSFANQLYKSGWWATAKRVRNEVESLMGTLPHTHSRSSMVGWHSFQECQSVHRWNYDTHQFETRGYFITVKKEGSLLDDRPALMKCLLSTVGQTMVDPKHLQHHVRPGADSIKRRWNPL